MTYHRPVLAVAWVLFAGCSAGGGPSVDQADVGRRLLRSVAPIQPHPGMLVIPRGEALAAHGAAPIRAYERLSAASSAAVQLSASEQAELAVAVNAALAQVDPEGRIDGVPATAYLERAAAALDEGVLESLTVPPLADRFAAVEFDGTWTPDFFLDAMALGGAPSRDRHAGEYARLRAELQRACDLEDGGWIGLEGPFEAFFATRVSETFGVGCRPVGRVQPSSASDLADPELAYVVASEQVRQGALDPDVVQVVRDAGWTDLNPYAIDTTSLRLMADARGLLGLPVPEDWTSELSRRSAGPEGAAVVTYDAQAIVQIADALALTDTASRDTLSRMVDLEAVGPRKRLGAHLLARAPLDASQVEALGGAGVLFSDVLWFSLERGLLSCDHLTALVPEERRRLENHLAQDPFFGRATVARCGLDPAGAGASLPDLPELKASTVTVEDLDSRDLHLPLVRGRCALVNAGVAPPFSLDLKAPMPAEAVGGDEGALVAWILMDRIARDGCGVLETL